VRYAIIANPVAGKLSVEEKRRVLAKPASILGAEIYGLNSDSEEEFAECARAAANRCSVLVVAGGDGTFSAIINAIDISRHAIAYLPLGTGNALRHALGCKKNLVVEAARIRQGRLELFDLISCNTRRFLCASVGLEGTVILLHDRYREHGSSGWKAYFRAALKAILREYRRTDATVLLEKTILRVPGMLTAVVSKHPYYGFGFKVIPAARYDDGKLHILLVNSGLPGCALGAASAFTIGNRIGEYRTARRITLNLERPQMLQTDGTRAWEADKFTFQVVPKALKIQR
jgi:diacylglycerol kinase family enzyme